MLDRVEAILDKCREFGLTAVVSMSHFPIDPKKGFDERSPEFWTSEEEKGKVLVATEAVVMRLSTRGGELAAYQVIAEPLVIEGKKKSIPSGWPELRLKILDVIREYDDDRWVVVSPGPGGTVHGYEDMKPLDDEMVVYGADIYAPHRFTHQGLAGRSLGYKYPGRIWFKYWDNSALKAHLGVLREFQSRYGVYVWIGEFSAANWAAGSDEYVEDLAEIFDSYGWGWSYFCYKCYHGWDPDYGGEVVEDNKRIEERFVGKDSMRWRTLRKILKGGW